ncbi:MAG: RnfABCDGE type electron transport complex subunit D, partial [Deltaproteobacteria bacterium]|nr:RnfABCDGE type electron transport complex subunit D [Deltaproteobacteria bacterium]
MSTTLYLQSSPHIRGREDVRAVMFQVVLALVPALAASVIFFGARALLVLGVAAVSVLAFEALFLRLAGRPVREFALDGSGLVTALLLAMNLPSGLPVYMIVIGAFVSTLLGKHVFGGLGNNPFNPALVGRVFLLISFPTAMTTWPVAAMSGLDATTAATPLGIMKTNGLVNTAAEIDLARWLADGGYLKLLAGNRGGCLGESSVVALLLGGLFLLWRRIITWEIPLSFVATVAVVTGAAWAASPDTQANPLFHVLSGGLLLGAFFMATDMVTSPVTRRGQLLFGAGCGLLTALIRL